MQTNSQAKMHIERKTWTESALMISPLSRLASSKESLLFPAPVGPDITITFCLSLLISGGAAEQEVAKSLVV